MKKSLLFGASAAAMLITAPALAQVELKISGGVEFEAGYVNEDVPAAVSASDNDDFDFQTESEIVFTARGVADNGLAYGARIDLDDIETNKGVGVDEVSIFLEGGWGTLVFGDDDGAADNFETDPPTVGNGQVDGSWFDYVFVPTAINYGTRNSGDTTKIYYASPSFSGFQVGLSYTPEDDGGDQVTLEENNLDANNSLRATGLPASQTDARVIPATGTFEDLFEAGAKYTGAFSGFSIETSGTIQFGEADQSAGIGAEDIFAWQIGVKGGTGPFEVGLQYWDNGNSLGAPGPAGLDDQYGINVAGTYSVGAWDLGLGYSYAETELNSGSSFEDQAAAIGFGREIAAGLSVGADVVYFNQDGPGADWDGWVAITSVSASF